MTANDPELAAIREASERSFDEDERSRPHAELPETAQVDAALRLVRPLAEEGVSAA